MVEKSGKKYVSDNAQIMKEWNLIKNNDLRMISEEITFGLTVLEVFLDTCLVVSDK